MFAVSNDLNLVMVNICDIKMFGHLSKSSITWDQVDVELEERFVGLIVYQHITADFHTEDRTDQGRQEGEVWFCQLDM